MEDTAMLIIIDKKAPEQAKNKLSEFGQLIELETSGITYDEISGHPDIFFCKTEKKLIIAPNLPKRYYDLLNKLNIKYTIGEKLVGQKYPETAHYNACIANNLIIHNLKITDEILLQDFSDNNQIHINQGYSRCNLLYLGCNKFITSDKGIEQCLRKKGYNILFINPQNIELQGFSNGFIGGCTGIKENKIFFNGSLSKLKETRELKSFIPNYLEIIELHSGNLIDIGSILFLDNDATISN